MKHYTFSHLLVFNAIAALVIWINGFYLLDASLALAIALLLSVKSNRREKQQARTTGIILGLGLGSVSLLSQINQDPQLTTDIRMFCLALALIINSISYNNYYCRSNPLLLPLFFALSFTLTGGLGPGVNSLKVFLVSFGVIAIGPPLLFHLGKIIYSYWRYQKIKRAALRRAKKA